MVTKAEKCESTSTKEVEVLIRFPNLTDEQRKHLYKAATELETAGVTFDTGVGCEGNDWEFDWSLTGAKVYLKRVIRDV